MGAHATALKDIAKYLHEGITWKRLQTLAVRSVADGGLALMTKESEDFKHVFSAAPPRLIDERPECQVELLGWLRTRQHILGRLLALTTALKERVGAQPDQIHCFGRCIA